MPKRGFNYTPPWLSDHRVMGYEAVMGLEARARSQFDHVSLAARIHNKRKVVGSNEVHGGLQLCHAKAATLHDSHDQSRDF